MQDYSIFTNEEIEKAIKEITADRNYYRNKLLLSLTESDVKVFTEKYEQCLTKLINLLSALDSRN